MEKHIRHLNEIEKKYLKLAFDHADETENLVNNFQHHVGMDFLESSFILGLVKNLLLEKKQVKIVEISPNFGWSSTIFKEALNLAKEKRKTIKLDVKSFDLIDSSKYLNKNSKKYNRDLILGDVREKIFLDENLSFFKAADYVFIDADHSFSFGKFLAERLLPLAKEGCILTIHDWAGFDYTGHQKRQTPEKDKRKKIYFRTGPGYKTIDQIQMSEVGALKHFGLLNLYTPLCNFTDITYKIIYDILTSNEEVRNKLTSDEEVSNKDIHKFFTHNSKFPPRKSNFGSVFEGAENIDIQSETGEVTYSKPTHGMNSTQLLIKNSKQLRD